MKPSERIVKYLIKMDKILRDNSVEYDKPKANGEIGMIMGIPVHVGINKVSK